MDSTGKGRRSARLGASRRGTRRRKELSAEELARLASEAALAKKAEDLVILKVSELVNYTDYLVIVSGRSSRQNQTIADHVQRVITSAGRRLLGVEGYREGLWILIDAGEVIIHIFHQPLREFYELEKLWGDAPRLAFPP